MASPDFSNIMLSGIYPLGAVIAVLSAIAVLFNIPPLIWHGTHRNFAPAFLIFCIVVSNFSNFLMALMWRNDDFSRWYDGKGFCDVQVKFSVAHSTALPAATLCILMKLAAVMDTRRINLAPTKAQQTRAVIVDVAICFGIPLISMILHFVVQSARFAVTSIAGCVPLASNTIATAIVIVLPPLLLIVVDAYFAVLIIYRLKSYHTRFDSLMRASNTTKTRFVRLFLLSMTLVFVLFPLQLWLSFLVWPPNPKPFDWSRTHNYESWANILLIPSGGRAPIDRWIQIASGFLIFIFFGMGRDARDMYKSWAAAIGLSKVAKFLKLRTSRAPAVPSGSQSSFLSRTHHRLLSSFGSKHDTKTGFAVPQTTTTVNLADDGYSATLSTTSSTTLDDLNMVAIRHSVIRQSMSTDDELLPKSEVVSKCSGPAQVGEAGKAFGVKTHAHALLARFQIQRK